jgi:hypothetical protein
VKCLKLLLPFDGTPRTEDGKVNYKKISLVKKPTYGFRTTGRRNMALGQIYTWTNLKDLILQNLAEFG